MYSVLSLFPDLLAYSFFGPTILRIAAALIIAQKSSQQFKREDSYSAAKIIALVEILSSVSLFLGLYTQAAAILLLVGICGTFIQNRASVSPAEKQLAVILSVILISLLITGPGALAADLPL